MTRLTLAMLVIITLLLCAVVYGQSRGFVISGPLTATAQESQEGYFHVGAEFMVITKPNSPIHDDLKAMIGHKVIVALAPDSK